MYCGMVSGIWGGAVLCTVGRLLTFDGGVVLCTVGELVTLWGLSCVLRDG